MKVLSRIVRYLLPSKGKIALVLVVSIMTSLLGVVSIYSVLPLLNAVFTADRTIAGSGPPETAALQSRAPEKSSDQVPVVFNGFDTEKLKASVTESFAEAFHAETKERTLLNICLFLIGAFAVKNLFVYMNGQLLYRIQTKTAKQLRDDVFNNIIEMHLDYFNKNRVGNLMNLVYNDVQTVNESVSSTFVNFLQNPFAVVVYACVLLVLSWKLTLFATVTSLLIFFVISIIGKQVKGLAATFRTKMGDMNSVLQEKFSGIKVIKSSAFENVELQRFQSFTRDFRKLDIRIARLRNIISPVNETLLVAAIALVLWFGGLQVFEGRMTSSELILFAFTLYSTMGPIKKFGDISSQMAVGKASAERLFELLDTVPDISNGSRSITGFSHEIRFEDVSFKYSKEADAPNVLDHVSFELKKGEMVALVGQSGSGKSTTVDLLLRFYDVDSGRITIDGIDIREYDFKQLRRMIGVVSQEVILFNDTIKENIAYGIHGEISQEKVIMAAKMANAHQFIEEKPEQYDTLIGDRGVQLSGGQRQRLAIARAMVKNPELLVFDEATSALDNESEKVVQEAIDHALENRTALVVAHRLSTVRNADRIIVMERGRAVESGSHEELLARGGLYRQLYDIQFSGKTQESERTPVAS
ncbi:ABC transporter ATP-binding protein [Chlorobium sp. BLA1]|uniref:ABC transporter ATP-binding protein n=1 Tax=Candidatus Chlorobium masyuteum TaxID=2716876 RepID=UPI00142355D5|nr:ABC transporter ATP-binding protein [Candidatus Chlorobium masyuteum]NHQ59886.1 ABC transporter ATP-binding protein [Candidatus Chlorobium masyuteum]